MYLVAIAWIYVVLMMSLAEATSSQGSVLGAVVTFVLYGALPLSIVMYLLGTPVRRKARLAQEARDAQGQAAAQAPAGDIGEGQVPAAVSPRADSAQPNGGGEAPGPAVAPVGKEP